MREKTNLLIFCKEYYLKNYEPPRYSGWSEFYKCLLDYQIKYSLNLLSNDFDRARTLDFIKWLEIKYMQNSCKTKLDKLKALMRACERKGYLVDEGYQFVFVKEDPVPAVTLSVQEIKMTYKYVCGLPKKQQMAIDLFLISCLTGLRWLDVSNIKPHHIHNKKINILTQKTKTRVVIPMHPIVCSIMSKYNNEIKDPPSNGYANIIIRKVYKALGFNAPIARENKDGVVIKPRYEYIRMHTGRRTFATNAYNAGILAIKIMKITGHTTERSFFKYIKIDKEKNAEELAAHPFFNNI